MGQTVTGMNVCLKIGDPIALTISTQGSVVAEIGDTAKFMIKRYPNQSDLDAIISKDLTVITDDEIPVYVPSSETELLSSGVYYWSIKHYKATDEYTIIPDGGCEDYPTMTLERRMIDG